MDKLIELAQKWTGKRVDEVRRLGVSGSHRVYYRLYLDGRTLIGVVGSDVRQNRAFVSLANDFRRSDIFVPKVYAISRDGHRYLQSDLGDTTLYDAVAPGRKKGGHYSAAEEKLLCKAIEKLPDIQLANVNFDACYPLKKFDASAVDFDLNYFKYCFLKPSLEDFDEVKLQEDFERLKEDVLTVPAGGFMYRDFQPRNIMIIYGDPWFIDFQGGRRGPLHYDVASFICQASARYSDKFRRKLVDTYLDSLSRHIEVDRAQFLKELDMFILLRLLQVLGCYGYRGLYERKQYFINSIAPAMDQIRHRLPLPRYPYLSKLLKELSAPKPKIIAPLPLTVSIRSFSYKKGIPADESGHGGGYVFDCRGVNNPGRYPEYAHLTGRDASVIEFIEKDGSLPKMLSEVYAMVDPHVECFLSRNFDHLQVSFGCTGGHHRSVYSAEHLAQHLKERFGNNVIIDLKHTEI